MIMRTKGTRSPWLATACVLLAIDAHAVGPDAAPTAPRPGQQLDCDQLAAMPNAPMSLQSCRQAVGAMQAQTAAASDPAAARAGDAAMSCADIAAEMRTMQGVGLSQAQQRENATAVTAYQSKVAEQQGEINRMGIEATAAVNAGLVADTLTQLATGGLVMGRAAQTAQQAALAQGRVRGQQMAEARKPVEQRVTRAVGDSAQAMGQSARSNPRFARLVELAMARQCRE
jgi:hypothetical protein